MTQSMNRRMFLRGAGGSVMAIPFLPSLLSRAFAADPAPGPVPKCFFAISTNHGGVWGKNRYPSDDLLTQSMEYAGRTVRYGNLPSTPDANGNVVWSPMCTAKASVLTPTLASKFNILRGLDVPYRISHHVGAQLGNFGGGKSIFNKISTRAYQVPTIDQVMAWSPSFYSPSDIAAVMSQRSFCVYDGEISHNYTSPTTKTGNVVQQKHQVGNLELYNYLFKPGSALGNVDEVLLNRYKQNFDRLKKDPRLSKGDLARLDEHLERMSEIERKMSVVSQLALPPQEPKTNSTMYSSHHSFPHDPLENELYWGLMNDMIVAAFSSGISRVATSLQSVKFVNKTITNWHGNIAHQGVGQSEAQQWTMAWNKGTFEHVMVDLASKMDQVSMADGQTLLDHSLILFTNEAGQITHHGGCVDYPMMTAGGAGGYFKTGMFVDFSNKATVYDDLDDVIAGNPLIQAESPGLYYQQFLANALMSMGVPKEEWETFTEFTADGPQKSNPTKGYGFHFVDPKRAQDYAAAKQVMSDKLPVITA